MSSKSHNHPKIMLAFVLLFLRRNSWLHRYSIANPRISKFSSANTASVTHSTLFARLFLYCSIGECYTCNFRVSLRKRTLHENEHRFIWLCIGEQSWLLLYRKGFKSVGMDQPAGFKDILLSQTFLKRPIFWTISYIFHCRLLPTLRFRVLRRINASFQN